MITVDGLCLELTTLTVHESEQIMAHKWCRHNDDIISRVYPTLPIVTLLQNRERGDFSKKDQHHQFIESVYYSWFPETTPRALIVERRGDKYTTIEFKFHLHCHDECLFSSV